METTTLAADWREGGPIESDSDGKLAFPPVPIRPGAYELRLVGTHDASYVGETDNLRRRFGHYRNPGPTQRTNIRINDQMRQHIAGGGHIFLWTCTSADLTLGDATAPFALEDKASRQLVESARILHLRHGGVTILNA